MTKHEREILQALVNHPSGLLSPSDFINGVAKQDRRAVENLVAQGYVEEVPQDVPGMPGVMKSINFYRATEKSFILFAPFRSRAWFSLTNQTALWLGIATVFIGILALISSYAVPWLQGVLLQHDRIQAIYKNLITNEDIYISNANTLRDLNTRQVRALPEPYLIDDLDGNTRRILQDTFGLVQYRFFSYYLEQVRLLNSEISELRDTYIASGPYSNGFTNAANAYSQTLGYLDQQGTTTQTRFSFLRDTECIQYFFELNFQYLSIDKRGRIKGCSEESLSRIFNYFGYLPVETPEWLKPGLKEMLNKRQAGLGDQLIDRVQ